MIVSDQGSADPRPYVQLAARFRDRITSGQIPPGHFLPSITHLRRAHGYARGTCSKSMRILESEGLVVRVRGLGYYVPPKAAAK